jgi:hypothetical protein
MLKLFRTFWTWRDKDKAGTSDWTICLWVARLKNRPNGRKKRVSKIDGPSGTCWGGRGISGELDPRLGEGVCIFV